MRALYNVTQNVMRNEKGEPAVELVLHTFEGRSDTSQMMALEVTRIWFKAESLRKMAEVFNECADQLDALPKLEQAT